MSEEVLENCRKMTIVLASCWCCKFMKKCNQCFVWKERELTGCVWTFCNELKQTKASWKWIMMGDEM
jgi:hypothetical protein